MVEIVAEISGNHGGERIKAEDLIYQAARAGCQYAKFQYYRPEDMPDRYEGNNDEMYRKLMIPDDWLPYLFKFANYARIGLFASVFSGRAAKEILQYDVPYIKLASPASTQLAPIVYSEITNECSAYPCAIIASVTPGFPVLHADYHLCCPPGHPQSITKSSIVAGYYGFSDHTPGIQAPLAFIRAGAKMIEKHIKLDDDCVDAAFSADFATMRKLCRIANG